MLCKRNRRQAIQEAMILSSKQMSSLHPFLHHSLHCTEMQMWEWERGGKNTRFSEYFLRFLKKYRTAIYDPTQSAQNEHIRIVFSEVYGLKVGAKSKKKGSRAVGKKTTGTQTDETMHYEGYYSYKPRSWPPPWHIISAQVHRALRDDPDLPREFVCPISQEVMMDPVVTRAGVTYERAYIVKAIQASGRDPCTRLQCTVAELRPNSALTTCIHRYALALHNKHRG